MAGGYGDEMNLEPAYPLALVAGMVIDDRYALKDKLGNGGMGEVWKAYDQRLGTTVAIKILRTSADLPEDTEIRFEREMQVMNTMDSPLVVAIHDRGRFCGRMYLVMAFLEGTDMESALEERVRLPWREVLRIISSVSEVLQEAHARGLLHRDLKPANIFLQSIPGRADPVVRVLDFGVAKIFGPGNIQERASREVTQLGSVIGTPKYMAPEQFYGEAGVMSDLYSLGVVAYHALCGDVPFPGPTLPQVAFQHCSAPVPPLPRVIPPDVCQLVMDLLIKAPGKRIPTAADLRMRIDDILSASRATSRKGWSPVASYRTFSSVGQPELGDGPTAIDGVSNPPSLVDHLREQLGSRTVSKALPRQTSNFDDDDQVTVMADHPPTAIQYPSSQADAVHAQWLRWLEYFVEYITGLGSIAQWGLMVVGLAIVLGTWAALQPNISLDPSATPYDPISLDSFPPPGMIAIAEGPFLMGCNHAFDVDCGPKDLEMKSISLGPFYIDQVEVSVEAYAECVNAGACDVAGLNMPNSGGDDHPERAKWCNWGRDDRLTHPINCLSWVQAKTFCEWAEKRLPTETEWEKAARGTAGQQFPWGDAPPNCRWVVMSDGGTGCGRGRTWPVSGLELGESPYGVINMSGNIAEWTSSQLDENLVGSWVYRGGSWGSERSRELRSHYREAASAEDRFNTVGVRCAWSKGLPGDGASGGFHPTEAPRKHGTHDE